MQLHALSKVSPISVEASGVLKAHQNFPQLNSPEWNREQQFIHRYSQWCASLENNAGAQPTAIAA